MKQLYWELCGWFNDSAQHKHTLCGNKSNISIPIEYVKLNWHWLFQWQNICVTEYELKFSLSVQFTFKIIILIKKDPFRDQIF